MKGLMTLTLALALTKVRRVGRRYLDGEGGVGQFQFPFPAESGIEVSSSGLQIYTSLNIIAKMFGYYQYYIF